jgi:hypothetical protein
LVTLVCPTAVIPIPVCGLIASAEAIREYVGIPAKEKNNARARWIDRLADTWIARAGA